MALFPMWARCAALEFDANEGSRAALYREVQVATMAQADGVAYSVQWTLADNSTATLTLAQLKAVIRAIAARTGTIRELRRTKRAAILSALTVEQVAEVKWST